MCSAYGVHSINQSAGSRQQERDAAYSAHLNIVRSAAMPRTLPSSCAIFFLFFLCFFCAHSRIYQAAGSRQRDAAYSVLAAYSICSGYPEDAASISSAYFSQYFFVSMLFFLIIFVHIAYFYMYIFVYYAENIKKDTKKEILLFINKKILHIIYTMKRRSRWNFF